MANFNRMVVVFILDAALCYFHNLTPALTKQ